MHALWEEASAEGAAAAAAVAGTRDPVAGAASGLAWLPRFYGRLLQFLDAEHRWAGRVLPQHRGQLLVALTKGVLGKVGGWLGGVGGNLRGRQR